MSTADEFMVPLTLPLHLLAVDMGPHPETGEPSHSLPYTCQVGYGECLVRAITMFTSRQAVDEFIAANQSAFSSAGMKGLTYDSAALLVEALKSIPQTHAKFLVIEPLRIGPGVRVMKIEDAIEALSDDDES